MLRKSRLCDTVALAILKLAVGMSGSGKPRETLFTQNYIIICLINLFIVISSFPLVAILPLYLRDNVTPNTTLTGLIIGIFPFCALLSRFFAGWALDNFRIKPLFAAALLGYSLFFLVYPWVFSVPLFLILRAAHGFIFGVAMTAAAVIRVLPLSRRGEGVGYFSISLSLGMAAGPFIALKIITQFSFLALFIFFTVLILAGWGALVWRVKLSEVGHRERKPFAWSDLFLKRALSLVVNVFVINTVYAGLVAFVVLYAVNLNYSDAVVSMFFLIMSLVMLCSRLFAGRILDARGPRLISSCGIVVLGVGSLLMAWTPGVAVFLLGGVCVGLGVGILFPVLQTMINNMVQPRQQGVANASYYVGLDFGWVCGTTLSGFVVGLSSIAGAYVMNAGLCVAALVLFLTLNLKHYNLHKVC